MAAGWTKVGGGDLEQADRVTDCCVVSNQMQCQSCIFDHALSAPGVLRRLTQVRVQLSGDTVMWPS